MIEFLKKHYFIIGTITIFVGVLVSILWGEVEFVPKQILTLDSSHQPVTKDYIFPKIVHPIAEFISSAAIPFGITLIITMFFVNNFTKQENDQLRKELLDFQNNTAEDAIYSIFKTIIEPSFFEIVKEEVLNCKMIRKEAKWIYDIEEKDGKLMMTRTISYVVKNLSTEKQSEPIKVSGNSNSYVTTRVLKLENKMEVSSSNGDGHDGSLPIVEKKIEIEGGQSVEVKKIVEQVFQTNFIYETHFAIEPLADLEIQVNYPEGYSFSLNQCFCSQFNESSTDRPNRKIYKFKNAILKGQGVEFFCEKKTN